VDRRIGLERKHQILSKSQAPNSPDGISEKKLKLKAKSYPPSPPFANASGGSEGHSR